MGDWVITISRNHFGGWGEGLTTHYIKLVASVWKKSICVGSWLRSCSWSKLGPCTNFPLEATPLVVISHCRSCLLEIAWALKLDWELFLQNRSCHSGVASFIKKLLCILSLVTPLYLHSFCLEGCKQGNLPLRVLNQPISSPRFIVNCLTKLNEGNYWTWISLEPEKHRST